MSETSWSTLSIRECLIESFAGEWGAEPLPGNARVLRATDIDDEGHVIGYGALRRLPIGKLTSRQLEDGDILLEGSGGGPDKPVGRVAFFDIAKHQGPAVCSNFFKTLRPDPRLVEPKFLWRKLMWFYRQPMLLTFQQQTTGIINLKFEEYLNAAIEVPANLAEQRAIAQILDTLDTAIRETEALIDKLKAVKQGLLHDLLTRGIDANGQLRPPQSEAPQLYKKSPLGWIPREWEVVPLGEIASRSSGLLQTGPFGSQLHAHEYVVDGIPVVMPQDMVNGELSVESIARITQRKAVALSRHRVRPNDLVFSRRGDLSRCVAIEDLHEGWLCGTGCLLARLPAGEINGYWLSLVYQQPGIQSQVMGRAVGSTMANLNTSILAAITIARPDIAEQNEIALRLKVAGQRISGEERMLAKMRFEKTGLMDDLLTGRVRVTPMLESVQRTAEPTEA